MVGIYVRGRLVTPFSRRSENVAALDQTVVDVAAPEEEPVKVEDEVKTKISTETVVEDRREAGELTHVDVDIDAKLKVKLELASKRKLELELASKRILKLELASGRKEWGLTSVRKEWWKKRVQAQTAVVHGQLQ